MRDCLVGEGANYNGKGTDRRCFGTFGGGGAESDAMD